MNSKCLWVLAAVVCVGVPPAFAGPKISVIQPGTDRLVHLAEISVYAPGEPPTLLLRGRTGRAGEPVEVEEPVEIDPSITQIVVVARKGGTAGTVEINYDPQSKTWQQAFIYEYDEDRRDWRRLAEDPATGNWNLLMYDYQSNDWRRDGTYEYDSQNDRWSLFLVGHATGRRWERNRYVRRRVLEEQEGTWELESVFDPGGEEKDLNEAEMIQQADSWKLPVGRTGPQSISVRLKKSVAPPVRRYHYAPHAAYGAGCCGCCCP